MLGVEPLVFFFFNDAATAEIYTFSLPHALPISLLEITTVAPPVVRLLLFASRAWTVITCVLDPLATIEAVAGAIVEFAATSEPLTTDIPSQPNAASRPLLIVDVIVAEPVAIGQG